ncbi:acyl-CoA dehydrogenase family protein [Streptomyces lanatus]|uniref:Acyl-CoA dehydrogenase family protein n=1 Tax=Streptomyces lanatus TaxID=66900 RepID=A0ABV1Y029_9ACTN|nr:acyl-CoA dehydrogenase family protein [Streptomyces lanatus]GHH22149.1 acyl-CoA dehydrogenase [Streptomyces lanatus]
MPTTPPAALAPYLTPDHHRLWHEADAFAAQHIAPRVRPMEVAPHKVERRTAQLMADNGWFGVTIPSEYRGMAAGHVAKTVLIHRTAVVSAAAAAILQASLIPTGALQLWGTAEQKAWWLPRAAAGRVLLSIAVTEPQTGGHIGGMETVAEQDGDEWVITGSKAHIGNSHLAGLHVIIARTAPPGVPASQALTAFLVERDRTGLVVEPHRTRLGLHGFTAGRLRLGRVRIPAANVLGEVGQGLFVAQSASILFGRPNLTALSLGIHEAIVATTADWLSTRPRYGAYLSDHPVVRYRLGGMYDRLQTAQGAAYQAVHLLDQGLPCDAQLIGAKNTGHELAADSARDAMELHAADGLDGDYLLQRLFRDIQHTYAPAGTGEFQRIHLAKTALGESGIEWSERLAAERAWASPDPTPA